MSPLFRVFFIFVLVFSWAQSQNDIEFPLKAGEIGGRMVIVDSSGKRVKLAGVNWSGGHLEANVVNGLDKQRLQFIAEKIASLGFNHVRLTYSLDLVYGDIVVDPERLAANPELIGKTALEIYDEVVKALTSVGLMVILNNHMSTSGWCCSFSDMNGFWYTPEYPEEVFFDHWGFMADRYKDNPLVIGADLRNEVRGQDDENVTGGIRYATWGLGIEETDWNVAAEKAAIRVHEANPDMLIIVGGIFTGGFLTAAGYAPIQVPDQSKLVYEGHIYPTVPVLSDLPYDEYELAMQILQTFVEEPGHEYSAPFWMGEFGSGPDNENWRKIMRFLKERDLDWAYWCIDGYQFGRGDEGYGILKDDFDTIRDEQRMQELQEIMPILSN